MIERLAIPWGKASFAAAAALSWLCASFVICPEVSASFVSEAGVAIVAAIPPPEPIIVSIEDDDRELQEDDLELCWPPDVPLVSPSSLTLWQLTPPQNVSLSSLTPAPHPLRC